MTEAAATDEAKREWDEAFNQGQTEPVRSGGIPPDGDYQARIVVSRVEQASWGDWQCSLQFETAAGTIWKWLPLTGDAEQVRISGNTLKGLGYTGDRRGVAQACEDGKFLDLICNIRIKTKPGETRDFTNVYINQVVGRAERETWESETTPDPDSDIPF